MSGRARLWATLVVAPLTATASASASPYAGALQVRTGAEPGVEARAQPEGPIERPTHGPPLVSPVEEEPPRGLGMLVAGSVLAGIGLPATLAGGITMLVAGPADDRASRVVSGIGAMILIPGAVLLAVGTPLTVVGARRYHRWRRWQRQHAMTPSLARTSLGAWTVGLRLEF